MAANQAVVGVLRAMLTADTASFDTGMGKANTTLKLVETNTKKVGAEVAKLTPQAERMVKAFSGDKLLYSANSLVAAITKIGGATKLTTAEQARANKTLTDAIAKYAAMGQVAPKAMLDLEKATRGVTSATNSMTAGMSAAAKQSAASINMIGGMSKAGREAAVAITSVEKPTSFLTTKMIALGAATGTFLSNLAFQGVRTLVAFGKEAFTTAGRIIDLADKTGLSTTTIQRMQFVADQTSTSLDAMTTAAFRLGVQLAGGGTSVRAAVGDLKLSFEAIQQMRPDQQFEAIVGALSKIDNAQERNRLGVALFGKQFGEIAAAVEQGYLKIANAATLSSDAQLKALDKASDRWSQFITNTKTNISAFLGQVLLMNDALRQIEEEQGRKPNEAGGRPKAALEELERRMSMGFINTRKEDIVLTEQQTKANESYAKQLAEAQKALAGLTAAQRAEISAAQQMGASQEDQIALLSKWGIEIGIAEGVLKIFTTGMAAAKKEAAELTKWIDSNAEELTRLSKTLQDAAVANIPMKAVLDEFGSKIDESVNKAVIFGQKVPPAVMAAAVAVSRLAIAQQELVKTEGVLPNMTPPNEFPAWDKLFDSIDLRQRQSLEARQSMIIEASTFSIEAAKRRGASERELFALTEQLERDKLDVALGAEEARFQIAVREVDRQSLLYAQLAGAHQDTVNVINTQWELGVERRAILFESEMERQLKAMGGRLRDSFSGGLATLAIGQLGHDITGELKSAADEAELDFRKIERSGKATAEELETAFTRWREAEERASFTFGERWKQWMGGIQKTFVSILDDMLQYFIKNFIGGLAKGLTASGLGQKIGQALGFGGGAGGGGGFGGIGGGVANSFAARGLMALGGGGGGTLAAGTVSNGVLVGVGAGGGAGAAPAGAAGVGGGAGGSFLSNPAFWTNPYTIGIGVGIGIGMLVWKKGLFRGGAESLHVNPKRDKFLAQFGGPGTGPDSGFQKLAERLTKITGQPGGGPLHKGIREADTVKEWELAQGRVLMALSGAGMKNVRGFSMGGFVPPGVVQPAILHGGRFGEDVVPRTSASGVAPTVNQHYTVNIHANALNAEGMDAVFARDIVPRLQWEFRLNQRGTVTVLEKAMAR